MSRSVKKNNIHGICSCRSEKLYKKAWHKSFRKDAVNRLANMMETRDDIRIFSDPWLMGKDGKVKVKPKFYTWEYALHTGLVYGGSLFQIINGYNNQLNFANKVRRK